MPPTFRAATAAALTATALVAGGCGSSKSDNTPDTTAFRTAFTAESARIKALGVELGTGVQEAEKKTDAQIVTQFTDFASRAHDAADAVDALAAPATVKPDMTTLARALTKVAGDLDQIVTTVKAGDLASVKKASSALVIDAAPVKDARAKAIKDVAALK